MNANIGVGLALLAISMLVLGFTWYMTKYRGKRLFTPGLNMSGWLFAALFGAFGIANGLLTLIGGLLGG